MPASIVRSSQSGSKLVLGLPAMALQTHRNSQLSVITYVVTTASQICAKAHPSSHHRLSSHQDDERF